MITRNGNVGIGTTNPTEKLDVNGNAVITGSLEVTNGLTGSLFGTASFAQTASYAPNYIEKSVGPTYTTNTILTVTQAEYDVIVTKDSTTLYFIV